LGAVAIKGSRSVGAAGSGVAAKGSTVTEGGERDGENAVFSVDMMGSVMILSSGIVTVKALQTVAGHGATLKSII